MFVTRSQRNAPVASMAANNLYLLFAEITFINSVITFCVQVFLLYDDSSIFGSENA